MQTQELEAILKQKQPGNLRQDLIFKITEN